jgi:hypothetical protein
MEPGGESSQTALLHWQRGERCGWRPEKRAITSLGRLGPETPDPEALKNAGMGPIFESFEELGRWLLLEDAGAAYFFFFLKKTRIAPRPSEKNAGGPGVEDGVGA